MKKTIPSTSFIILVSLISQAFGQLHGTAKAKISEVDKKIINDDTKAVAVQDRHAKTATDLPYREYFDVLLPEGWILTGEGYYFYNTAPYGRTGQQNDYFLYQGTDYIQHGTPDTEPTLNRAMLPIDLTGYEDVLLSFWWKLLRDHRNQLTGVFLSDDDGQTFTRIFDFGGMKNFWQPARINLNELADLYGLSLGQGTVISFQCLDLTGEISGQNLGIDHVVIDVYRCNTQLNFSNRNDLHFGGQMGDGYYSASGSVTASSNVNILTGTRVKFFSQNSVRLQQGFHSRAGSSFYAGIATCGIIPKMASDEVPVFETDGPDHGTVLYPNPSPGMTYIDFGTLKGNKHVMIYTTSGFLVEEIETEEGIVNLDLGVQPEGLYMVRIIHSSGSEELKLILY